MWCTCVICVSVYIGYIYACACMQRPEKDTHCLCQVLSISIWERVPHWSWSPLFHADWLTSKLPASTFTPNSEAILDFIWMLGIWIQITSPSQQELLPTQPFLRSLISPLLWQRHRSTHLDLLFRTFKVRKKLQPYI